MSLLYHTTVIIQQFPVTFATGNLLLKFSFVVNVS